MTPTPVTPNTDALPTRIDVTFRNGSITSIGVILAFSLGYLTKWAGNPVPWRLIDAFALTPMAIGCVLQSLALVRLLSPDCLELTRYRVCVRWFVAGLAFVVVGVGMAVIMDSVVVAS
ncbi:MAG: hypothetical protein ABI843_04415 [Dokdonella sp.]